MKSKSFECFFVKQAFFAALLLLIPFFHINSVYAQKIRVTPKSAQPEAVFTNPNPITIVDATGTSSNPVPSNANPYPSTINVSGLAGTIAATPGSVKVTLNNFSHSFPDDISIVLVGPTGAAFLIQSGATINSGAGQPASNITYTISDSGATPLPNDTPLTAGTFKPAAYYSDDPFPSPGPGTNYANPGPVGGGTATFSSVFGGTNPNGTWSLFIRDFAPGDSGSISGGWTLEIITTGGPPPFDNRLDFFGNGFSDWSLLSFPQNGSIIWRFTRNDNPTPAGPGQSRIAEIPFGLQTLDITENPLNLVNFPAFGDYTGDGKMDLTIWREGAQALYWILRSDNFNAFNFAWGTTRDSSGFEGDYDGDGRMDYTIIRIENGGLRWWIFRSGTNTFSTFVFGLESTDIPLPGTDYTGDGADDPAVARINSNGSILWIVGTTTGGLINKVQWGNYNTDFIVPAGDYDGDSKADFVVWRGFGNAPAADGVWYILRSTGGVTRIQFGIPDTNEGGNRDIPLRSGDYDGDKITDIAVWRRSNRTFYVRRSSDGQLMTQPYGLSGDFPLAGLGVY